MRASAVLEGLRMMKLRDVMGRWQSDELSQLEAAELLGMNERTFRRWRDRHREAGPAGLDDRRLAPSLRRAPLAEIERMLGLYRGNQASPAPLRPCPGSEKTLGPPQETAAPANGGDDAVNGGEKFPRIVGQKFPTSF